MGRGGGLHLEGEEVQNSPVPKPLPFAIILQVPVIKWQTEVVWKKIKDRQCSPQLHTPFGGSKKHTHVGHVLYKQCGFCTDKITPSYVILFSLRSFAEDATKVPP